MAEIKTVTGNFRSISGNNFNANRRPQLLFKPVAATVLGNAIVPETEYVVDVEADGSFEAPLLMNPDTEFEVAMRWQTNPDDPPGLARENDRLLGTFRLWPGGSMATLIPPDSGAAREALLDLGIMLLTRRQYTGDPIHIEDLRGVRWAGDWAIWHHDLIDGPPIPAGQDPLYLMQVRHGTDNVVKVEVSTSWFATIWAIQTRSATEWTDWRPYGAGRAGNVSIDTDGRPYYDPGSWEYAISRDTDGRPYYERTGI